MQRGRLAPSPTGNMHIGNVFSFLMAFCHIRQMQGTLVLRIEDIDEERSEYEYIENIYSDLMWLGITYEEGPKGPHAPYYQSQRKVLYEQGIEQLEKMGVLYPCFCSRKDLRSLASAPHNNDGSFRYTGRCKRLDPTVIAKNIFLEKKYSLRLDIEKALAYVKARSIKVKYFLEKEDNDFGGDFAVMRSDGVMAYQLAVVLDDIAMNITSVVRGSDLIDSTAKQRLLFALFDKEPPIYNHVPLIYSPQGERLAKRHSSLSIATLREMGVTSGSILGYLSWLCAFIDQPRVMTAEELICLYRPFKNPEKPLILPGNYLDTLLQLSGSI